MLTANQDMQHKKTTYKNYLSEFKWKVTSKSPSDIPMYIDIKNLCFCVTMEYIKRKNEPIEYIHNFIKHKHEENISMEVISKIKKLSNIYDVKMVLDKKNGHKDNKVDFSSLQVFKLESYRLFCSKINNYLKDPNLIIPFIISSLNNEIIYVDENHLNDTNIFLSTVPGTVYSTNLDILLFGKDSIYKQTEDVWYVKTRDELTEYMGNNMIYSAMILGCSYCEGVPRIKRAKVLNDPNKKELAKKMLIEQGKNIFLEYAKEKLNF